MHGAEQVPEVTDEQAEASEESPSHEEESTKPEGPARRRARTDWRAFVRTNARALVALGFFIVGIVLILLGWYGAAYTNILTEQIPYLISGGLLGLGLIIVAGILASSALHERESELLRHEIARAVAASPGFERPMRGEGEQVSANGHQLYVVPGGRSYHVAGCPMLEGKDGVKELQPAQASESGYVACKLCGPE
jgi:hypothetical protein